MSPVPSTASTPPTSAPSTAAALATTASGYPGSVIPAPYHSMNPTTSAIAGTSSSASSFTGPVSLSTAPHYGGGGMPFPRRAEFSYAQNIHNHPYGYSPTPTMMGQPQLPRPRTLQMPVAPLLQTQQQQQQMHQQQQMMTPTSATTTTMVPEIPSSAPDGPPTGGGGARKRPKYTRSKKGCLTCRSKKIKCDERHPMCTRCEHGHRECTWPEAVLPRRPKGAMRGIGGEGDEEIGLVDEEGRRQSIPGSAVSTHFPPPSSTTSSHFPGISNNSPFEPAPRRDAFESDGFPAGSQFSVPALPANNRPFYPRQMGAAALPSGEFYPVPAVNGQPIEEYEFPPRQTFGTGASSSAAVAAAGRPTYPNGTLYPGVGAPSSSGYAADLRRASWDSSAAATDARRPSWDASGAHASSVSSPASSVVGLGLTGGSGGPRSVGSSAGNTTAGSSISGGMGGSGIPPGGLMLLHSPDPLSPFFRSVQERNLIKHYCHSSANIIMALPPTPNPILAVTLPIVLDKPPGTHAPTEALRLALLGVGAVHMAYLTSRRRVCVGVGAVGPGDNGMVPVVSPMGVSSDLVGGEADAARMMGLSSMLRLGATRCLAVACRNPEETRSDAALGATMAITLIDIFSGGHQWTRNINLAKTLIALRGGPSAILNSSVPKQARFGGGVTVSPARFWLEMLAVYETFGSLTSGEEPTLLAPGNTDWWFDDGNHSYHANSIEKVFGMARSMITLIAKVSAFLCRTIRERAVITEEGATLVQLPEDDGPAPMPDLDMPLGTEDAGPDTMIPDFDFEKFLNDFGATPGSLTEGFITGPTSEMSGPPAAALTPRFDDVTPAAMAAATTIPMLGLATDFNLTEALGATQENPNRPVLDEVRLASLRGFYEDAKVLYAEVESWEDNVTHDQREARVLVGNKTHKLALQIIMLRDVFHVPRMDPRVQTFAASILDLCLESSQQNMGVDLTWPVIIAGCQVVTANARIQVAQAFDSFRKQCCFEIESSERIVAEVWRRVDNNEPRDDWRAVVEDEGLRILVL